MKTVRDVELRGKHVLVRVDFNVPLDNNGVVADDSRIRAVLPVLNYVLQQQGKLIIMSHLGRPKGKRVPQFSLTPVIEPLNQLLGRQVCLLNDCIGTEISAAISSMLPGDILLLENLRFHPEEEQNDEHFASQLARHCQIYVNEAFSVSHRKHASVDAITRFAPVSLAGLALQKELDYFHQAMESPERPLIAVVGGAKVSGKLQALENMLKHVDALIIGGAMANTFLKASGYEVGTSKIEEDLLEQAANIIREARQKEVALYFPIDAVIADRIAADADIALKPVNQIPADRMILDIGPETGKQFANVMNTARTIVWNGPMGVFELEVFSKGTMNLLEAMVQCNALTIAGGGDTDAAVHQSKLSHKLSYISSGGGAFLTLLEGKELPGVRALMNAQI